MNKPPSPILDLDKQEQPQQLDWDEV
jgi:hypothetical protein